MKINGFLSCLVLAGVLCLTPVCGHAAEPAPLPAAEDTAGKVAVPVACEIVGHVGLVQAVQKSPWRDNTPSPLSVTEVQVVLLLEQRKPRNAAAAGGCDLPKKYAKAVYKLCSPTRVKKGDRIRATEGSYAIDPGAATSCLFDVAVLPPQ